MAAKVASSIFAVSLLLAGCATEIVPDATPPLVSLTESRGAHIAERDCSACHAIGPTGDSPSAFAPPFRNLRMRYNPVRLERHIADLAKGGVFSMPPQTLSSGDAEDVAAYIERLRPSP